MKTQYKFAFILSFLILLSSCHDDGFKGFDIGPLIFFDAAIYETCQPQINFVGDDIYGEQIIDQNFGNYWQLGGHPPNATNELPDLGLNIFVPELETGLYEVTNDFITGKAFIYYIDENGNEYNSTINNSGNVSVVFTPGSFSRIEVTFNNVEVYNATLDLTKCINEFNYSYAF